MQSLNEFRNWFMTGRGNEDSQTDIHTEVTITFQDGRAATADLSIGWFDGKEPRDHIGMELWVRSDASKYDEGTGVQLNIMPGWDGWTLDDVVEVFNIDPDAPVWKQEDEND